MAASQARRGEAMEDSEHLRIDGTVEFMDINTGGGEVGEGRGLRTEWERVGSRGSEVDEITGSISIPLRIWPPF